MIRANKNLPLQSLIFTNLLVIFFALYQSWNIVDLIIVYWAQSVIIGIFNFFRILGLEDYSTEGFRENGVRPLANKATKIRTAIFFAFHYGFFHLIYFGFIMSFVAFSDISSGGQFFYILLGIVLFFINHLISYRQNIAELKSGLNIGTMMFRPYIRIIPIHLLIVFFGAFLASKNNSHLMYTLVLLTFLALKIGADIVMHLTEKKKKKVIKNNI